MTNDPATSHTTHSGERREELDIETIRQLLAYNPVTGSLTWKERSVDWFVGGMFKPESNQKKWNTRHAGKEFGCLSKTGYLKGIILYRHYRAHRVCFAIYYGYWPNQIDHINGVKTDNRISNIRSVNSLENNRNLSMSKRNTSGCVGVHWSKSSSRWVAAIKIKGRNVSLGSFDNIEDAKFARAEADKKYGFHPNHGRQKNEDMR